MNISKQNHPFCLSSPKGWFGHGHSFKNPAKVTLDYDLSLPVVYGPNYIPAGTPHLQWESPNFGWWKWTDKQGNPQIVKF